MSMTNEALEQALKQVPVVKEVKVEGDGYHYKLTIVSNAFIGKSKLARQQWVYALVKEYITSGSLHALSMETWTEEEWERQHG